MFKLCNSETPLLHINVFATGIATTQGSQQNIITQFHWDIENKIKTASCTQDQTFAIPYQ